MIVNIAICLISDMKSHEIKKNSRWFQIKSSPLREFYRKSSLSCYYHCHFADSISENIQRMCWKMWTCLLLLLDIFHDSSPITLSHFYITFTIRHISFTFKSYHFHFVGIATWPLTLTEILCKLNVNGLSLSHASIKSTL